MTFACAFCGYVWKHEADCGDRTCFRCNSQRIKRILARYIPLLEGMSQPKLLTLTLRNQRLTRGFVRQLRQYFNTLRRRVIWRASGRFYCIEFDHIDELGLCNLHIHAIIDSPFIGQRALSLVWKEITRGSKIVDIRTIYRTAKSHHEAVKYLTKYLAQLPSDLPEWQRNLVNDAYHDVRLIQTFGTLSGKNLNIRDAICPRCGKSSVICLDFEPLREDIYVLGTFL